MYTHLTDNLATLKTKAEGQVLAYQNKVSTLQKELNSINPVAEKSKANKVIPSEASKKVL